MTARFAKDQMSFVMPTSFSNGTTARDAGRRRAGLGRRIAALAQSLLDLPRRRAVISELSALSDHELRDIGLSRCDLAQVFNREFAAARSAARGAR
jgi:uncharacterized protein YjiS (DUF1127 family)